MSSHVVDCGEVLNAKRMSPVLRRAGLVSNRAGEGGVEPDHHHALTRRFAVKAL
jgi:hypothetical protein